MEATPHHHRKKSLSKILHDLKTPLNIILMSSEMLERKDAPTEEYVKRHSAKIIENANRINELLEELRDL